MRGDREVRHYQPSAGQRSQGLHQLDGVWPNNWQLDLLTIKDIFLARCPFFALDFYKQRRTRVHHCVARKKFKTKMRLLVNTVYIYENVLMLSHTAVLHCLLYAITHPLRRRKRCRCVYRGIFLQCHVYTWKEKLMLNTEMFACLTCRNSVWETGYQITCYQLRSCSS